MPGETYVEFPYDWRRDNRVAARRLQRLADEKLHAQRQRNPDAKLILIGHSMGGLVARYFLECLDGWRDTRMLITFGTPHRGSLNAVDFLVNGFVKKLGPLKVADLADAAALADVGVPAAADLPVRRRRRRARARRRGRDAARRRPRPRRPPRSTTSTGPSRPASAAHDPATYAIHSVVGITQGTKQSGRAGRRPAGRRGALRRRRHGRRRHRAAGVGDADRDRRLAAGVPADVLRRPARLAAERRAGADAAAAASSRPARSTGFRAVRACALEADELLAAGESLMRAGAARRRRPDAAGDASPTSRPAATSARRSRCAATPTRCTTARCRRCRRATTGLRVDGRRRLGAASPIRSTALRLRRRPTSSPTPTADPPRRPTRAPVTIVRPARRHRRVRAADQPAVRVPQRHRRARARTSRRGPAAELRLHDAVRRRGDPRRAWSPRSATHLGAAGPGDVALFAYAGHGSEEPAPPEIAAPRADRPHPDDGAPRLRPAHRRQAAPGARRQGAQPC